MMLQQLTFTHRATSLDAMKDCKDEHLVETFAVGKSFRGESDFSVMRICINCLRRLNIYKFDRNE